MILVPVPETVWNVAFEHDGSIGEVTIDNLILSVNACTAADAEALAIRFVKQMKLPGDSLCDLIVDSVTRCETHHSRHAEAWGVQDAS